MHAFTATFMVQAAQSARQASERNSKALLGGCKEASISNYTSLN